MKPYTILAALLLGTWILHTWDLLDWRYWYHPRDDDWEFIQHAQWYALNLTPHQGQWWRLADLHDVDGFLSGGDAWFQGLLMHVFGTGYRGYKLAVVAQTVATVGVYTALAWRWYGERTALIVCALLGSSWLWIATDHHGYGSIMRGALCIGGAMLAAAYRLPVVAGIVAGLGWYCFYTGRLALPCALLVLWGNRK